MLCKSGYADHRLNWIISHPIVSFPLIHTKGRMHVNELFIFAKISRDTRIRKWNSYLSNWQRISKEKWLNSSEQICFCETSRRDPARKNYTEYVSNAQNWSTYHISQRRYYSWIVSIFNFGLREHVTIQIIIITNKK